MQRHDLNLDFPGDYLGKQSFHGANQSVHCHGVHTKTRKRVMVGSVLCGKSKDGINMTVWCSSVCALYLQEGVWL